MANRLQALENLQKEDFPIDSNRSTTSFAPGGNRAIGACVFLGAALIIDLLFAIFLYAQSDLLTRISTGAQVTLIEATANDSRLLTLNGIQLIVFIITAIAVLLWIHRAHRNLSELGAQGLVYSPGWAVGGFFIPFVNLVRPFQVVREIWKASDPADADGQSWKAFSTSPLISLWWIFYIGSNILTRLATINFDMRTATLGQIISVSWTQLIGYMINAVSAGLLILIIRGIELRQREKSNHPPIKVLQLEEKSGFTEATPEAEGKEERLPVALLTGREKRAKRKVKKIRRGMRSLDPQSPRRSKEERLPVALLGFTGWIAGVLAIAIMLIVWPLLGLGDLLRYQTYSQYLLTHLGIWVQVLLVGSPGAVIGGLVGGRIGHGRSSQQVGAAIGGVVGGIPFGFLCFAFFSV